MYELVMYAYAATEAQIVAHSFLVKIEQAILFPLITLMMAVALLVFLYGAFEYVRGANDSGERETGARHLLYGTIGMLVMLCALAILSIAAGTFDLNNELQSAQEEGRAFR
jgi:NADH:ubiquinone oxidoreductase subunit 5 (subunit L)/multisubunit Na+/H+ antiporter MnhA subunit